MIPFAYYDRGAAAFYYKPEQIPSHITEDRIIALYHQDLVEEYSDKFRSLCCWLSIGECTSESLMAPNAAEDKIRTGIEYLLKPVLEDKERLDYVDKNMNYIHINPNDKIGRAHV